MGAVRVVVIAMLLAAMVAVPPAGGDVLDNQVLAVSGTAEVGSPDSPPCDPSGKGLHVPAPPSGKDNDGLLIHGKEAVYEVVAGVLSHHGSGSLHLCGDMAWWPLGIGAACGTHSGWDGAGSLIFASRAYSISDLHWVMSIGGTFVVTGHVDRADKFPGTLRAYVQAQGGQNCINSKPAAGATSFNVVAVGLIDVAHAL